MKILVEKRGGGGDLNKPVVLPVENRGGREGVWSCFSGGKIKRTCAISLWSLKSLGTGYLAPVLVISELAFDLYAKHNLTSVIHI